MNSYGEVVIQDTSKHAMLYSSQRQQVYSVLPAADDGSNTF